VTQTPAGWYVDPAPAPAGSPPRHRWWDGHQWTEHVQPAPRPTPYGGPGGGRAVATTPDGQRLAGWWHRVGAYVIDGIIQAVIAVAAGWPFVRQIAATYGDYFHAAMRASENGTQPPGTAELVGQVVGSLAAYGAIAIAVSFVYNVAFLKALQATPGKLLVGLRVRLRERPGSLPWRAVLLRWLVQNAGTIVAVVPYIGSAGGLYNLLDDLWPLWDEKKQAIHDKAARTNVVLRRG